MPEWIVWVEAVNFASTILDTNDLATVRGGGLAALFVSEAVQGALANVGGPPQCLHAGASQCAFRIATPDAAAATDAGVRNAIEAAMRAADEKSGQPPHAYMMHVVALAPIAEPVTAQSIEAALKLAEARGHSRQFRQWTAQPIAFNPNAKAADPLDGVRPATESTFLPGRPGPVYVSPSVKARREYGRTARQELYASVLGDHLQPALAGATPDFEFAPSFQDIVADPPGEAQTSVRGKIAVVYADGNGFGVARDAVGMIEFDRQLAPLRHRLLATICDWLVRGAADKTWADVFVAENAEQDRAALRFETILWGGDEMAFVLPAWLATAFVEGFFRHTADWAVRTKAGESFPLTHAVGVAIGHAKVPIRQLRGIAKAAADGAKEAGLRKYNSATFEIFESLHPPDTDLFRWRESVFGAAAAPNDISRQWALPGDDFAEVLRRLNAIVWGERRDGAEQSPFPRSQLYAVLRKLREDGRGVAEAAANEEVRTAIGTYASRAGADRGLDISRLLLPTVGGSQRGEAMDVALVATLWDYANPFGADFPRFAGLGEPR
ncbi:MAG: hypothetical protein ABR970_22460 [Roseiarcus sp.]|jgi:hypothetical protein